MTHSLSHRASSMTRQVTSAAWRAPAAFVLLMAPAAAAPQWSVSSLPQARAGHCAVSVGGKVIFAGGAWRTGTSVTPTATVDVFDEATGQWSTATLSAPRGDMAATVVGTKALFAGGFRANTFGDYVEVDVYDAATDAWTVDALSVGRSRLAAATVGSMAIFAGGIDGIVGHTDVVDLYDSATDQWSTTTLSEPRAPHAATVGQKAFFAGGEDVNGWQSASVDIYDGATGQWSTATLSQPRIGCTGVVVGSSAVFAGGYSIPNGGNGGVDPSSVIDAFNDAIGTHYCAPSVPNSTGAAATMSVLGFPGEAAQGTATLTARGLPKDSVGLFLTGRLQGMTPNAGGGQGTLCLGGAIGRFVGAGQAQDSGVGGRFALAIDLTRQPQPNGFASVLAGETWCFQAWYRDANPGATSNFTDAVSVVFL